MKIEMRQRVVTCLLGLVWMTSVTTGPPSTAWAFTPSLSPLSLSKPKFSSLSASTWTTSGGTKLNDVSTDNFCPVDHITLDEDTPRDISTFQSWAFDSCGVQKADGFDLVTEDGKDYFAVTRSPVQQGNPVLYVPEGMVISSRKSAQEFGQFLTDCKDELEASDLLHMLPLFLVFVKILVEYQKATNSPYYPWLNSLPRLFNTGASMTFACFDCLPDYASQLALQERKQSVTFQKAAQYLSPLFNCRGSVLSDADAMKWAYNVAVTRSIEVNGEQFIVPMADMFNHGSTPETTEVQVSFDEQGNCLAYASKDIPANTPLRRSYGEKYNTNPSPLFAKYGFLDESSPASFCKVVHLQKEIDELKYDYSQLLFYKDTGDISMEVYDVVLLGVLKRKGDDQNLIQGFRNAVLNRDDNMKNQYHQQFFPYTKEALQKHVGSYLSKIDKFERQARTYDPRTHPRVPLILKHNAFVKETFMRVKQKLDSM